MKKYISIITVVFATVVFVGCKKGYLDQEVNPNAPSVSTPSLTLSAALANAAAIVNGGDYSQYGVWGGYWTTSGSYVPSQTINEYQFTDGDFEGAWGDLYSNLTNFNTLKQISTGSANANFSAIATIMTAYDFEQLVDNYNNVPYSQAFQPSTILFPAYDKGLDIYHDLGTKLVAAIALINANPGATNPGGADIVFGGNMASWVKFANSIRLRLAIRVSTKIGSSDPLVTALTASSISGGFLDGSTEAAANPGYAQTLAGSGAYQASPFWATYGSDVNGNPLFGNVYYKANEYGVKNYTNYNDPRATAVYTTVSGVVIGNVFGDTKTTLSGAQTSSIGPGLLIAPTQPAVLFSGAESLFLQAEAANDGFIAGTAQTLYQSGITASFQELGLTAAQAATYYGQTYPSVGWSSSANKELAIITQKWLALNGYGNFEAWNEYRRTGYPVLPQSIDPSAISPTLPTRLFYPLSEVQSNGTSLANELKTNDGGAINVFTSKIFWAK